MRLRFIIVLPALIILNLVGFVGDSANSGLSVRYHKETEWIKTNNPSQKDSKCFFYSYYLNVAVGPLIKKPWSDDYILYFNEKIRHKLISQIKIYRKREPLILIMNKSYIPRKSIDNHLISC